MTQRPEPLPSGRWRGVARSRLTGGRESQTFDSYGDAADWAEARERVMDSVAAEQGVTVTRRGYDRPSLADYALSWARTSETDSVATRRNRESHAREIGRRWPTQRVDEITRPMVRAYLAELRQSGRGAGTREARLSTLRRVVAAAIEDGYRDDDPTVGVTAPAVTDRAYRVLTDDELTAVLDHMPEWLRAAVLLSHDAGLRIGEVAGLRAHRLDLLHRSVTVADVVECDGNVRDYPKGRDVLSVPLTPRLAAALRAHTDRYPPAGRTGHVFYDPHSKRRLSTARIRAAWQRARAAAGLGGDDAPRWHDLRHGCAYALVRAGAPAYVIMAVLRHANLKASQVYIRRVGASEQAQWLGRAFSAASRAAATA